MDNSFSTFLTNLENSIDNLFRNDTPSSTDTPSTVNENDNNSTNKELSNLVNSVNNINNNLSSQEENINDKLREINLYDNSIKKNNELMQLLSNRGTNNLTDLQRKEIEIATKSAIVTGLDNSLEKQQDTISFLLVILALVVLLVIPLVLMIIGKISKRLFMILFIIDFVLICLVIAWKKNFMYLNSFVKTAGTDLESTAEDTVGVLAEDVQKRINRFNQIVRADVYGSESAFQSKYCCPDNNKGYESDEKTRDDDTSDIDTQISNALQIQGMFYNDGSAPSQLLVPDNTRSLSKESNNSKIFYPDFAIENRENSLINKRGKAILNSDSRLIGDTVNTVNL